MLGIGDSRMKEPGADERTADAVVGPHRHSHTLAPEECAEICDNTAAAESADDTCVYEEVLNRSPRRRTEDQRRRNAEAAATIATLRYSTNPLHLVVQQKIMASMGTHFAGAERSEGTNRGHGLVPSRPTTAPFFRTSRKVSPPPLSGASDGVRTRPSTGGVRSTPSTTVPYSDQSVQTMSEAEVAAASGSSAICVDPPAHLPPVGDHLGSCASIEDMMSTPKTKQYLEQLLMRPTPFCDYAPAEVLKVTSAAAATTLSVVVDDAEDSDSSREPEPASQQESALIESKGSSFQIQVIRGDEDDDSSVDEEADDTTGGMSPPLGSTDVFTPTSAPLQTPDALQFPAKKGGPILAVPATKSPRSTPGSDNGCLLELVPTMSRPQAEFASVISRTMSSGRGLKQAVFPAELNTGVPFVDTIENSANHSKGSMPSSLSPQLFVRDSRMSFKVHVDQHMKSALLKIAASVSRVSMPGSHTTPTNASSRSASTGGVVFPHGPFGMDSITVNGSSWHPTKEVPIRPHEPSLLMQITPEGIFIVCQKEGKEQRVFSAEQLSRRRAANSENVLLVAMESIVNIRCDEDAGGRSRGVALLVARSEAHSPLIRSGWFPSGASQCSVTFRTGSAAKIVSSFSTVSIQRLRLLTEQPQHRRKTLTIVHFNDVYNLIEREGPLAPVVGGAARFHTLLSKIRERAHPLVLFSGDFMGPSLMSVDMKGKHMVDFLNQCGVHYACFGNHEFDYGLKALNEAIQGFTYGAHVFTGSNTKWVMSNMFESSNGLPVSGASQKELFTWNGVRVGIVGLCEDWINGCSQLAPGEIVYIDMFETGERLARELKSDGAEVVIALTHCRLDNDKQLMLRCPSIDLLLGGHDHFFKCIPALHIVKSGEEFQYLSEVTVSVEPSNGTHTASSLGDSQHANAPPGMVMSTSSRRTTIGSEVLSSSIQSNMNPATSPSHAVSSSSPEFPVSFVAPSHTPSVSFSVVAYPIHWDITPSAQMMKMIDRYQHKLDERMGGVVGRTAVPLDPRESTVRFREGLLTGFVCDVIVQEMRARLLPNADFAILGGAAFSGKTIIPEGVLTMGHIFDLFPNDTKVMAIRISGATLLKMLTVMVRECPDEAPSFPHCSEDLSFTVSLIGGGPPKILNVHVRKQPLELDRQYVVAVEDFAGKGSGKYKFLRTEAEVLIEEEVAAQVVFWLIDYFSRKKGQTRHTSVALEKDALQAEVERAKKERKRKGRRKVRNSNDGLLQSAIDSNIPKFVLPVKQFKTVEFASTLESGALARLYAATTLLSEDVESGSNVALIEKVVIRLLKCMACRVYLFDKASDCLRTLVSPHGTNHAISHQLPADHSSLAGYSLVYTCAVNTKNTAKDRSFVASVDGSPMLKVQSMLTFPIFYRKQCLGVVQALNKQVPLDLVDPNEWKSNARDAFEHSASSTDESSGSNSTSDSNIGDSAVRIVVGGSAAKASAHRKKRRAAAICFSDEDQGLALLLSKQIGMQLHFSNMYQRIQLSDAATKNLMEMARLLGRAQKDDSVQTMVLRITDIGKQLIGCDRCSLFLVDKGEMWTVVKTKDLTGNIQIRLPIGTGVAGHAAQTGTRLNIHDAYESPYFNPETDRRTGYQTRTILAVPMLSENGESILGVLQLINKDNGKVFTEADEDLAENFVNLASIAVHNSFEIETLRLGRDESTLQVLPVHDLNRIALNYGWRTVRRNLHLVAAMRLVVRGGMHRTDSTESIHSMRKGLTQNPCDPSADDSGALDNKSGAEAPPSHYAQYHPSASPNNAMSARHVFPSASTEAAIVRGMQDFDDLRSESDE